MPRQAVKAGRPESTLKVCSLTETNQTRENFRDSSFPAGCGKGPQRREVGLNEVFAGKPPPAPRKGRLLVHAAQHPRHEEPNAFETLAVSEPG